MKTTRTTRNQPEGEPRSPGHGGRGEPCTRIQLDLSAMLDGELDTASIRRVLVHMDGCTDCSGFLDGIRMQLQAHRELAGLGLADRSLSANDVESVFEKNFGFCKDGSPTEFAAAMRRELQHQRDQLSRILYELGRGYVLMGQSPNFTRDVGREPQSIADMCLRGRVLLDEVERGNADGAGPEWVRAKSLFATGDLRSPAENMARGKRLLYETLLLSPGYHEARIYLGHAHHVCEERELAKREFRAVLDLATEPLMRAFALENLGNVYLEEGQPAASIPFFREIVDSGILATQPRFFSTYFNLAFAYGLLCKFADCEHWLSRLHEEFPHKRRQVAEQLRARALFANTLAEHPGVERRLTRLFAEWFPITGGC